MKRLYRRFKRLYHWLKFLWNQVDYDAYSVFPLLEFKLKRVQNEMLNGYGVHDKKHLQALHLCIKILNRLSHAYHEEAYYQWYEKRWGELIVWTTPMQDSNLSAWHSRREKAVFKKDKEALLADANLMYSKTSAWYSRDLRLFFNIFTKYHQTWWD